MLAIIVPFHKIIFFEETLASLAAQTNKNFHVYIGNDASIDDPEELINDYKEKFKITYKSFSNNIGSISLTKQWDRCIEMVRDEKWIMVLGDDDVLSNNVVEQFYENLNEINAAQIHLVRFATQEINEQSKIVSKKFSHPRIQDYSSSFYSRFFEGSRSSLSEYIFSKNKYDNYGFKDFPYAWHSDDLAWLEFSEFGFIYSINTSLVYFRISGVNISRPGYLYEDKKGMQYEFFKIVVNEHLKKFREKHISDILKRYELMTYSLNRGTLAFWMSFFPVILKYKGTIEAVKFSRRVCLNYFQ